MLKLFSKDLLRYMPGQVVPALLAFVSIPLYTRILSAEQFGQYALVLSSVGIMVTLLGWLTMAVVRFYAAMPEQGIAILVRTSFWTQLASAGILSIFAFILARTFWPNDADFQVIVNIGLLIFISQSIVNILLDVLRARLQAGVYTLFMICSKFVALVFGVFLAVVMHLNVIGILWGIVLGIVIFLPFLMRRALAGVKAIGPVSIVLLRQLAWYGIPLMVGNISGWVLSQSDRYLIGFFYGVQEVGMYSAAYLISENSMKLIGVVFMLSSGPMLANVWEKQGQEASQHLLSSVTRLYLLVGIPAVAGLSVLAKPLMKILAGSEFADSYSILPWVVGGGFFLGLQHRFNQTLVLLKRTREIMFLVVLSGLLNVGLNWWWLPLFGYEIAAVTTLICYVFLCLTMATASRRYLRWQFPWLTALRSLCAAGVMLSVLFVLLNKGDLSPLWSLFLAVPIGVLIYGVSVWGLGEMSPSERKAVGVSLRRRFAQQFADL